MINPYQEVEWNPDHAQLRAFGKSLMIGFPCLALVLLVILRLKNGVWNPHLPMIMTGCGLTAGILFRLIPRVAKPFYWIWYAVACCIGLIITNFILGVVYYFIITAYATVMRAFGRDLLCRKPDPNAKTYWRDAASPDDPREYYKQY